MFTEYFGLSENPFNLATDFSVFFIDTYKKKICKQILVNFQNDFQPILVTGPLGVGKTQFAHYLLIQAPSDIKITYFSYHYISDIDKTQQMLAHRAELAKKTVLIIDNAHDLRSDDLKRLLASSKNLPNLQMLFLGLPELYSKITSLDPDLYPADQIHHYPLLGLTAQEVNDYIQFRLCHAGCDGNKSAALFSSDALKEIAALSHGMPHSINLLCGSSLLLTSIYELDQVSEAIVQEASLNSFLPNNKLEQIQPTNILDFPIALPSTQGNKQSLIKMRLRQSHFFERRATHLKRYALIHRIPVSAELPHLSIDENSDYVSQSTPQRNQLKRLSRGILAFCLSLALLFAVQFVSKPTPTTSAPPKIAPLAMQRPSEIVASSLTSRTQTDPKIPTHSQNSVSESHLTGLFNLPEKAQSTARSDNSSLSFVTTLKDLDPNPEVSTVLQSPPPLAKLEKIQLDRKIDTTQIDTHLLMHKTIAKATSSSVQKMPVKPIVDAQLDTEAAVKEINTLTPSKAGNVKPKSNNSHLQFKKQRQHNFPKQEVAILDPQEAAARDRAASKLDLARLGIEFGVEAFMHAAQTGNTYVLKLLLAGGMPPDVKNSEGQTALMLASRKGYKRVVDQLISAGAHPDHSYQQSLIVGNRESENSVKNF